MSSTAPNKGSKLPQLRPTVSGPLACHGCQSAFSGTVGRSWGNYDPLFGAVDDIGAYQGAMTDAQVKALYGSQAVADPEL